MAKATFMTAGQVAWFLFSTAVGSSQEPSALTLADAVSSALRRNETSGIADALVDQAEAVRRRAVSAFLPDLVFNGSFTRRDDVIRRDFGTGEGVFRPDEARVGDATATLNLFDARAFPVLGGANRDLDAQRLESGELKRSLAYEVAAGFYAVLSAELTRGAAGRRYGVAEQVVADARIRREAGLATVNDVTRSELELASARLALTQAERDVAEGRLVLGRLIGGPVTGRLAEPVSDSLPAGDSEALIAGALETRRDVEAARARAEALGRLAGEPLLGLVPAVSLRGNARSTKESGREGTENDWSLALLLSWTAYDGGDRYGQRDLRRAQAAGARLAWEARKQDVALEIRRSLNDLSTARAAMDQARVSARVAEQNALEVRERFASGLATALEQADAIASEFEAGVELARQNLALALARLSLTRALGQWPSGTGHLAEGVAG